jgi:hypothetical protein
MEIIWFGWKKKKQIRQGGPCPARDQTVTGLNFAVTGLNFGVTHPPKKNNHFMNMFGTKKTCGI